MIDSAHLNLLKELSTDEHPHGGRTLLEHLRGTHALLESWGNADDICTAGLFHSIYGTVYYKVESASLERRTDIAAVIGDRAEELAFLFCVTDRKAFFPQVGREHPVLENRVDGATMEVTPETIDALIEIETANYIEQMDPQNVRPELRALLLAMREQGTGHMSEGASAGLEALARD